MPSDVWKEGDKAKNRCCSCHFEWEDVPGPHTHCPICGNDYVEWLNHLTNHST